MTTTCPACGAGDLAPFHTAEGVPTNSCLLLDDEHEARSFPRGRLDLAWCRACGFITNRTFDPALAEYSGRYEETQGFSDRFVDFGRDLAKTWVERYDLHDKRVLEIGCGKGEFLVWMVEAGAGGGVGIDPGVHPERFESEAAQRIEWIADFYDESRSDLQADAVVCRHTLEHIHDVEGFLTMLRRNLEDRRDTVVLFELPDVTRVLEDVAFWDIYYEHCSYFSAGSLARLFRRCGFEVLELSYAFEDQYLLIEARPADSDVARPASPLEDDLSRLSDGVTTFSAGYDEMVQRWHVALESVRSRGQTAVVWGGGSKAVAFLSSLDEPDLVAAAVDINPHKQGRFIAGTGHRVLAPDELAALEPALVIAMNPIYLDEIRADLDARGLQSARLVAL